MQCKMQNKNRPLTWKSAQRWPWDPEQGIRVLLLMLLFLDAHQSLPPPQNSRPLGSRGPKRTPPVPFPVTCLLVTSVQKFQRPPSHCISITPAVVCLREFQYSHPASSFLWTSNSPPSLCLTLTLTSPLSNVWMLNAPHSKQQNLKQWLHLHVLTSSTKTTSL